MDETDEPHGSWDSSDYAVGAIDRKIGTTLNIDEYRLTVAVKDLSPDQITRKLSI